MEAISRRCCLPACQPLARRCHQLARRQHRRRPTGRRICLRLCHRCLQADMCRLFRLHPRHTHRTFRLCSTHLLRHYRPRPHQHLLQHPIRLGLTFHRTPPHYTPQFPPNHRPGHMYQRHRRRFGRQYRSGHHRPHLATHRSSTVCGIDTPAQSNRFGSCRRLQTCTAGGWC